MGYEGWTTVFAKWRGCCFKDYSMILYCTVLYIFHLFLRKFNSLLNVSNWSDLYQIQVIFQRATCFDSRHRLRLHGLHFPPTRMSVAQFSPLNTTQLAPRNGHCTISGNTNLGFDAKSTKPGTNEGTQRKVVTPVLRLTLRDHLNEQ